jgi:hypothetical protein
VSLVVQEDIVGEAPEHMSRRGDQLGVEGDAAVRQESGRLVASFAYR